MLSLPHLWYERYFYFRRKKRLRLTSIYVHRIYQNMSRVHGCCHCDLLSRAVRASWFLSAIDLLSMPKSPVCFSFQLMDDYISVLRTICPFYDEVSKTI